MRLNLEADEEGMDALRENILKNHRESREKTQMKDRKDGI